MPNPLEAAEEELEELPAFRQPTPDDPPPPSRPEEPEPTPTPAAARSTTSTRPSPPPSAPPETPADTSFSRTFSDEGPELGGGVAVAVDEEIAKVTAGLAMAGGMVVNRIAQRRTRTDTRLWLLTAGEAQGIGTPVARILARRAPVEIVEGDGADLLEVGANVVAYGMRNLMGIDAEEWEAAQRDGRAPEPREPVAYDEAPAEGPPAGTPVQAVSLGTPPRPPEGPAPAEPSPPAFLEDLE